MLTEIQAPFRLFQLISPSLPTGGFTYSQGLEWAVENGWITGEKTLTEWLTSYLYTGFAELEIPLLKRLYITCQENDLENFRYWVDYVTACRETSELRLEELNRGRAMAKLLTDLGIVQEGNWLKIIQSSQLAGFSLAAVRWNIDLLMAASGYTWSWLENQVMAAIKIVPLGQTTGQRVLCQLAEDCQQTVQSGLQKEDYEIQGSCPAFAISSALHETQYTRLFRS